jgi:hypothetical protein
MFLHFRSNTQIVHDVLPCDLWPMILQSIFSRKRDSWIDVIVYWHVPYDSLLCSRATFCSLGVSCYDCTSLAMSLLFQVLYARFCSLVPDLLRMNFMPMALSWLAFEIQNAWFGGSKVQERAVVASADTTYCGISCGIWFHKRYRDRKGKACVYCPLHCATWRSYFLPVVSI